MNTVSIKSQLTLIINERKLNMYKKAKKLGYTHPEVVAYSQELDDLINFMLGIRVS
ncbi:MAG: aspartyl-phosphate phosphatase Spo0E family protein [Paenisporosarcina sp.]